MTSADLRILIEFNYWARDRMLAPVAALPADQFLKPLGSSFSSVRDTVVHIYSAEWVWCERWHGRSPTSPLNPLDYPQVGTLAAAWRELETRVRGFVEGLGDEGLARAIEYRQMNGQPFSSPVWQMVQHVVNHGTYHRGQVSTLLRQLGGAPASTDLIAFYRERTIGL